MRVLFLASNGELEASTRYRILQFLPLLHEAGHTAAFSGFFTESSRSSPLGKVRRLFGGAIRRLNALAHAADYDVVVVHRELLPQGWNHLAPLLSRRVPLVFDFDDAVWLSRQKGWRALAARHASTWRLIRCATRVFAGNEFLAGYARQWAAKVDVIPTVVDTTIFQPRPPLPHDLPVVGWIGSPSTTQYLARIIPGLRRVAQSIPFQLRIVGAAPGLDTSGLEAEVLPWRLPEEVQHFSSLDIGLYPLANEAWAHGKCGFKAIQYMACGVPPIVSPIGVVREVARNGKEAVWASSSEEWIEALTTLLRSTEIRLRLGAAGRRRVEEHYSLRAVAPRWLASLEEASKMRP